MDLAMASQSDNLAEGTELQMLKAALSATYQEIADGVTQDRYVEIFDNLPGFSVKRSALPKVFSVFKRNLVSELEGQFEEMSKEDNLNALLLQRTKMIQEQKGKEGRKAWRPSGDPEADVQAHKVPVLQDTVSSLETIVEKMESRVITLESEVNQARTRASELQASISSTSASLQKLFHHLDTEEKELLHICELVPTDYISVQDW